jgi:hypothetical protein
MTCIIGIMVGAPGVAVAYTYRGLWPILPLYEKSLLCSCLHRHLLCFHEGPVASVAVSRIASPLDNSEIRQLFLAFIAFCSIHTTFHDDVARYAFALFP